MIGASELWVSYGALRVLLGVNLAFERGETVGIVGPNGAGKTTFLHALAGSLKPSSGAVYLDGLNITRLDAAARCRLGIARAHQIPRPFEGMTVFENVLVAATMGGRLKGSQANQAGLDTLALCGLLQAGDRRASTLGLLDRKRLELARALATNPSVLLLDEIGAGLTDEEANGLVRTIQEIRHQDLVIVWIEHIVHVLMQVVSRMIAMDTGRVIADGEPSEVMADARVIDAYLGGSQR